MWLELKHMRAKKTFQAAKTPNPKLRNVYPFSAQSFHVFVHILNILEYI